MTELQEEIRIAAAREKVWAVLAKLDGVQEYHPGVKKSYYTSEAKSGPEAGRVCELAPMGRLRETVADWQEGETLAMKIEPEGMAPPLRNALGRFSLRSEGEATVVTFTVHYDMPFGPLGSLMNVMMVKPQFAKMLPAMLEGLKNHCENGR